MSPSAAGLAATTDRSFAELRRRESSGDFDVRAAVETLSADELVIMFLPLAKRLAARYDDEDTYSDALVGLVKAANQYDPNRGSFAHYATMIIRQTMMRGHQARTPQPMTEPFAKDDDPDDPDDMHEPIDERTVTEDETEQAELVRVAVATRLAGLPDEEADALAAEAEFYLARDGSQAGAAALARQMRQAVTAASAQSSKTPIA